MLPSVSPNQSSDSHVIPSSSLSVPIPSSNSHPIRTRSKFGISKPKAFTATKHPIPQHLIKDYVPTTYLQASKHAHWRQAMQEEYNALLNIGTWFLVPSSPFQNLLGCKWVFRIKRKPDGTIDRYKARLVAKGFINKKG